MSGSRTFDAVTASCYWLTDKPYEVLEQLHTDMTQEMS